jgi:hypothetical protein
LRTRGGHAEVAGDRDFHPAPGANPVASSQLAAVAGADTKIIYSSYSGAAAATVVKSYFNLGLQQPLIINYANLSTAFVSVKDMLPPRLMGTSLTALMPELMTEPAAKERAIAFAKAYQEKYGERVDMINLLGKLNMDTVDAILRNVKNPSDAAASRPTFKARRFPASTPSASPRPATSAWAMPTSPLPNSRTVCG